MTRLFEFSTESLLCLDEHVAHLPRWFIKGRRSSRFGHIWAFDLSSDPSDILKIRPLATDSLPRILDHFYLWTPRAYSEARQLLLDDLFELAAVNYRSLVHPAQNIENISFLLNQIVVHSTFRQKLRVLDFGCGPGFSAPLSKKFDVHLTGYDRCPKMRKMARKSGLETISVDKFLKGPDLQYDAAFASYVFHLLPSPDDLKRLVDIIRPGGLIIGNFHKGTGEAETKSVFDSLNCSAEKILFPVSRYNHGDYWLFVRRDRDSGLLNLEQAINYLSESLKVQVDQCLFLKYQECGILPSVGDESPIFLKGDLDSLAPIFQAVARGNSTKYSERGFFTDELPSHICIEKDIWLPLGNLGYGEFSWIYPSLRHLANLACKSIEAKAVTKDYRQISWHGGSLVKAYGKVASVAEAQIARESVIERVGLSDFAGTAYYMGSKRDLSKFIINTIAGVLPPDGVVIDLMCGSGAASAVFSRFWRTYASDAQAFCRCLALVQGGGYSPSKAKSTLSHILETARVNENKLRAVFHSLLKREADLCHSDLTPALLASFSEYFHEVSELMKKGVINEWSPCNEVEARKSDRSINPFCLFTVYFSTVFFGLRQAIEIDSLRFAIESLTDEQDKSWALGALITATSMRATTYAAHFAQPPIRDPSSLSLTRIGKVLDGWASSVSHEFAIRFLHLAHQSEEAKFKVNLLPGPWEQGLDHFASENRREKVLVYLDAPYTREEYSRYYHVLETLVRYDYPSANGSGKVPSKVLGERFASELFTRSQKKMESHLAAIITSIVSRGWICAWSYSSSGSARIPAVIENVVHNVKCVTQSFATRHRHVSHRGLKPKQVTEYLLLFSPE